ncbi:hypothetical protein ABFX02_07G020300 [Erythranthe guttata]
MVCSIGSGKMTALAGLLDAGSISQTVTEDVGHQKVAAQYLRRELQEADEANLLDEEDMHIFGLWPMTDPLFLVCCNACRKPIKASQYAAHAELCKSFSSSVELEQEPDGPAVNKKPPRKERKKLPMTKTKKSTTLGEPKKMEYVDSKDIAVSESCVEEKIQIRPLAEAKRYMHLSSTHKMNGSSVKDSLEVVRKCSSQPLKRIAAESPSNSVTKNLCKTTAKILPHDPAPIATKIYYSQRNYNLRRAIRRMFFEEPRKESSSEVSYSETVQRDDHFLHLAQTPDRILAAKSGGTARSMTKASQLPVNNNILGPHYISMSYSGTLQKGSGSVPVV